MMNYLTGINGLHLVSAAVGVWLVSLGVRKALRAYRNHKIVRRRLAEIRRGR